MCNSKNVNQKKGSINKEELRESMETLYNMLTLHNLTDKQMIAIHRGIDALDYQLNNCE